VNKCIYLKRTEPELTFSSGEHIIPAGIGGIKKLPTGIVSDQANQIFSALELDFMRNSHISLPRQFYGPGKRGSLEPKKASKSNIHVMVSTNDGSPNLGYIKLGKPCSIPQLRVHFDGEIRFNFDRADGTPEMQISSFTKSLKDFDNKYKEINDEIIPDNEFILGIYNGRWYLAKKPNKRISNIHKITRKIIDLIEDKKLEPQYQTTQVTSHQSLGFNIENFFRVCAKIVFNFLALSKGQNFVLREEFDPIRSWIINGGKNKFVQLMDKNAQPGFLKEIPFPELSHKILITKINNSLIGIIGFYGIDFEAILRLTDNLTVKNFDLDGFICDWRNKKEYSLIEFISNLCH